MHECAVFPGASGLNADFNNYSNYFCGDSTFESTSNKHRAMITLSFSMLVLRKPT